MKIISLATLFFIHISLMGQDIQFQIFPYENLEIRTPTDLLWVENELYISTFFGGFHKFTDDHISFSNEEFESGLPDKNINKMAIFDDQLVTLNQNFVSSILYRYSIEEDEFELLFDSDEYEYNDQTSDLVHCNPRDIAVIDEYIICGTTCGLLIYHFDEGLTQIKDINSDGLIDVISDLESYDNELYFSTLASTSIYHLNIPGFEVSELYTIPEGKKIGKILPVDEGILFTNSDDEIKLLNNNQVSTFAPAPTSIDIYPTDNFVKENDTIYLTTNDDVHLLIEGEYISNIEVCGFNNRMTYGAVADNCNLNILEINNPVSVDDSDKKNNFTFYPNPSEGVLNIQLVNHEKNNIHLYNNMGKLFFSTILDASQNFLQIDTTNLPGGIYYLRVNNKIEKVCIM